MKALSGYEYKSKKMCGTPHIFLLYWDYVCYSYYNVVYFHIDAGLCVPQKLCGNAAGRDKQSGTFIVRTQFWQTLGLDRWNCTTFTLRGRSLFLYEKRRTAEGAVKTVYRNSEGSIDYSRDYSAASGSDRSIREGGKLVG